MLGYVAIEKAELKIKEYELYNAYYCGLCKTTGRRYGQLPRLALNYDLVFLALVIASLSDETDSISPQHCIIHPIKKKSVTGSNKALDYASDIMVLLAYYKLKDNYADNHNLLDGFLSTMTKPSLHPLFHDRMDLCIFTEDCLEKLTSLERQHCTSLDEAAEPFSFLMQRIFAEGTAQQQSDPLTMERHKQTLGHLGYHLGKWIYLMDALDDIEENIQDGNYNPLLYRYHYDHSETPTAFRVRIHDSIEYNLLFCLSEMSKAWTVSDIKKYNGLIENIIYMGMLRKTEQLLQKGITIDEKSL